ncbi:MAG: hypothetical protein Q4C14_03430 [Bacillota bacterium]|nr:hypothetical protein [Bacillota bacterium]
MLRIHQIKLDLKEDKSEIPVKIEKKLHIKKNSVLEWRIVRESVDARNKNNIKRIYTVDFSVKNPEVLLKKFKELKPAEPQNFEVLSENVSGGGEKPMNYPPYIVGFGPCGMFAGLVLARKGFRPVILERGKRIEERISDVEAFWKEGKLLPESNVQFGEGGAGAFSDGKLNSGIKNSYRTGFVLEELVKHGAPEEILYKQNPHVGTDILRKVVAGVREEILSLGGEIRFESCFTGIRSSGGRLWGVEINGEEICETETLIIAPGHSARDTFEMLRDAGLEMSPKPFSIGARVEHPQKMIDVSQYGSEAAAEILGAADYRLSYKCGNGRGVYTFCMCPGGYVVASASEQGGVVTNGMSYHSRAGKNANSALLVSVEPEDFGSGDPLAGIEFQRKWEQAAFAAGGGNYCAPAQKIGDFLAGIPSEGPGEVLPEYRPGVKWTDITPCLPEFAVEAMKEALPYFGKKIRGFDMGDGVLTAVETRSSSPVRINRNEDLQSVIEGIFPAGEGAGYAGGIMSAAVDGIRAAEKICGLWKPMEQEEQN